MNESENQKTEKKKPVKSFLFDTIKGVTLGVSVAVPGLSAGTIAVAERCYDTIINSVSDLRKAFKKNFLILLPFILGLIIGALAAFIGIQKGYKAAPFTLTGLFAGLVIGSLPVAISELRKGSSSKEKIIHILSLILCLVIAAGLGILTALTKLDLEGYLQARQWWIYLLTLLAGFLAAAACIVPGISGSMTMMVIGMYYPLLNTFLGENSILHSGDTSYILTGLLLAVILIIGILGGVIVSSKVMKVLLAKHRVTTFYGILGLILGSVISMFMNSSIYPRYTGANDTSIIQMWDYIVGGVLLVIAAIGMLFFLHYTNKKQQVEEKSIEG
jgi:putative membrane protein